ncbi:MAG: Rieske 2Fe-2S domain-containing protein [Planctomycetota bacterium]
MSARYVAVQWNRRKVAYDLVVVAAVLLYTQVFQLVGRRVFPEGAEVNSQILAMRAWGSCAYLMLTAILAIGPLARLDRRFLPILYNRRHLGVIFFLVALWHARQVLGFYHAYGPISELASLFTYDAAFTPSSMPFQLFGAAALAWFAVMAATSHDFWQRVMGARAWKTLHMGIYAAWALVVAHVAFGALQRDSVPVWTGGVALSVVVVAGLHLLAARRSRRPDRTPAPERTDGDDAWLDAAALEDLEDGRPLTVVPPRGERLLLLREGDRVTALGAVCAHQGGPLDEGRVIDGCLTCPWHGWQYRGADGHSPPPYEERIPTHRVVVREGRVLVDPRPCALDRPAEPCRTTGEETR